jgi:hypothetical protein
MLHVTTGNQLTIEIHTPMKLLRLLFCLCACAVGSALNATVLYSNAGPFSGTSFNNTWHSNWGQTFNANTSPNTVAFDLSVITHGTPSGSPFYSIEIRVLELSTGTLFSTTYPGGTSSSIHISTPVGVPTTSSYNITIRVSNNQSSSFTDYWEARLTNVVISN